MANTPVWPKYKQTPTDRTLWRQLDNERWVSEHGEIREAATLDAICDLVFESDGLAFCAEIELLPWFMDACGLVSEHVADTGDVRPERERPYTCEISLHPQESTPIGVTFIRKWANKRGRTQLQRRKVVSCKPWGMPCDTELLPRLRWCFSFLECGAHGTPGAAGAAAMNLDWFTHTGEKWPRHHRPPLDLVRHLSEHAVGARKEAYTPEAVYDRAYECDMTSGYAAQCDVLPSGTVGLWNGNVAHREILAWLNDASVRAASNVRHWWARCYVKLHRPLPMGDIAPFAVRDAEGELSWPTKPAESGGWWTYLWEFEAEEIQKRWREDGSMEVLAVEWAYTWTTETTQLSGWAETMDRLRHQAERELTPIVGREEAKARAGLVKLLIVAGIGRLGVPYETTTVLPESQAREGDVLVQSEVIPYTGLVARKEFQDMGTPMHWHKWVLSRMNFVMYLKLRELYLAGITTIYANVDGIGTVQQPTGTVAREAARRGDWKEKPFIYLSAPAPGQILAVDTNGETKVAIPGMAKSRQNTLLRGRLRRIGERPPPLSRGELLSQQGTQLFLDAIHELNWRTIQRVEGVRQQLAHGPPGVATG